MSEVINGNLNDVLSIIKEIQDKNVYPVFIPSLQKNVLFKELTTRQEKMLIKTVVDNSTYNSAFIFTIRGIIKENCAEDVSIDDLTIVDKTAICLSMRMKSIGDDFEYRPRNKKNSIVIKISDIIAKFNSMPILKDKVITNGPIKILCGPPTISIEYEIEREMHDNDMRANIQTPEDAKNAIGDIFINEIIKYIKQIIITKDDVNIELDMNDYTFTDRIKILEEIGNVTTNKILDYIQESNIAVKNALSLDDIIEDSTMLNNSLNINSEFFIL